MIGPEEFKVSAPEGAYFVNFQIDMYSLSFPILCHPRSLKREMIKYLEANIKRKDQVVNVMLIEKNDAVDTFDVLPLLVTINFIPKSNFLPSDKEQHSEERIFQFQKFIDQLSASGQLEYLRNDGEE